MASLLTNEIANHTASRVRASLPMALYGEVKGQLTPVSKEDLAEEDWNQ